MLAENLPDDPARWPDEITTEKCTGRIDSAANAKFILKIEQIKSFYKISAQLEGNRIKFTGFLLLDPQGRKRLLEVIQIRKEYLFQELIGLQSCRMNTQQKP